MSKIIIKIDKYTTLKIQCREKKDYKTRQLNNKTDRLTYAYIYPRNTAIFARQLAISLNDINDVDVDLLLWWGDNSAWVSKYGTCEKYQKDLVNNFGINGNAKIMLYKALYNFFVEHPRHQYCVVEYLNIKGKK